MNYWSEKRDCTPRDRGRSVFPERSACEKAELDDQLHVLKDKSKIGRVREKDVRGYSLDQKTFKKFSNRSSGDIQCLCVHKFFDSKLRQLAPITRLFDTTEGQSLIRTH